MLKAGDLAYADSIFSGKIPCKILEIREGEFLTETEVRITADRGPYKRGEVVVWALCNVLP